jgi:hypothetical protein
MFNRDQWFLNDQQDTAIEVYGPTGVASTPAPFEINPAPPLCGIGTYLGQITLLDCEDLDARIGIGDVAGSAKIDKDIYDSVNSPGKIGFLMSKDAVGVRWVPPLSEPPGPPPFDPVGAADTSFIFILVEGTPIV